MRIARFLICLLLFVSLSAIPVQSRPQVAIGVSVRFGPPVLPVYVQPVCPGPGFIWVPGYWAYGDDGYFWVPGTWVEPPEVGFLWTPGYWAFDDGFYLWHAGYWGPHVGFYGGIDYGFGYPGAGFYGGYWRGRDFFYNRSVTNINVEVIHNTYNTRVFNNNTNVTRVSFNGGSGGIQARPTSGELAAAHERHFAMTSAQEHQRQVAGTNRTLLASVNHSRPDIAATQRPGEFQRGSISRATNRRVNLKRPPENPAQNGHAISSREGSSRTFSDRPPSARPNQSAREGAAQATNRTVNLSRPPRTVRETNPKVHSRADNVRSFSDRPSFARPPQNEHATSARNERQRHEVPMTRQPNVQQRQGQRIPQQRADRRPQEQVQPRQQPQRMQSQRPREQQPQRMQQRPQREVQRQAGRQAQHAENGRKHDH